MSPTFFLILAIAIFANPLCIAADYVICKHNDDCDPGFCCSMNEQRYSIPTCRKMQILGDSCRPQPIILTDTLFSYPDGNTITVKNGYVGICPCAPGTTCNKITGTCSLDN